MVDTSVTSGGGFEFNGSGSSCVREEEENTAPAPMRMKRRRRRKSSFTFTHKKRTKKTTTEEAPAAGDENPTTDKAPAKKKKKIKEPSPAEQIISFEDRVTKGMFTDGDVKRMGVQRYKYTNLPKHPKIIEFMKTSEYKEMEDNPEKFIGCAPVELGCKELHYITRLEAVEFFRAVRKSNGFDLPFLPFSVMRAGTMHTPLSLEDDEIFARTIAKYSKLALLHYNKKHGSDFTLDRLDKVNGMSACVICYFITFFATSATKPTRGSKAFQAKVHLRLFRDVKVLLCRIRKKINKKYIY